MTLIIGLTGSIASGKSTVSAMFTSFNIPVVDADKISRLVVKPGEQAYKDIVGTFGPDILQTDNTINRKKLGDIIFSDVDKRKQLNAIVHPAVRKRMLKERDEHIQSGHPCVVLDIPLLFESNLTHFVNTTVLVYVEEHIQVKRLMDREGYTEAEACQRINSQIPMDEKKQMADIVLDNNGTKEETYQQLKRYLQKQNVI
ncbi:MAG TPA: dephospho-CoA kinase [Bacillota bacterium]|nr:dephospho-CoA kinase [Bacillota bacterium]